MLKLVWASLLSNLVQPVIEFLLFQHCFYIILESLFGD